jgi:hypothetical protein
MYVYADADGEGEIALSEFNRSPDYQYHKKWQNLLHDILIFSPKSTYRAIQRQYI